MQLQIYPPPLKTPRYIDKAHPVLNLTLASGATALGSESQEERGQARLPHPELLSVEIVISH